MYGGQEKFVGQKVNFSFFTVDPYSVGMGVSQTFLELGKSKKNIFWKIKTSTIKSEKIYIIQSYCPWWLKLNVVDCELHLCLCDLAQMLPAT